MKLRTTILFAGICAGSLLAQSTLSPAAPAGSGGSATRGAAGTRANHATPATPGPRNAAGTGMGSGAQGRTGRGGRRPSRGSQPPAPAETGKVEVTGRPSHTRNATGDNPLLPIATSVNGLGLRSGTPIQVKLRTAIDSGHARNGDMVDGALSAPLGSLPVGTPVRLTVVQSSPAGQLTSYGELSIQVVSIADRRVLSDTVTAQGKEGAKELPDAAPARGTEASFTPDQPVSLPAA